MTHFIFRLAPVTAAAVFLSLAAVSMEGAAIRPLSLSGSLAASDDQTTGDIGIGFAINFGGTTYNTVAVNTNGNLSFGDGGFGRGTPESLSTISRVLIAPFWADVDTRGSGSISYGAAAVNGRNAFVATYSNVGYYLSSTGTVNSFQVLLFDRSDTGAGNFDIEFNYDQILWETGDNDGGTAGKGGTSAVAGFTSGVGVTQLAGSLVNGAFLNGGSSSLVANSLGNSPAVAGRYDFSIRNGAAVTPTPEPATAAFVCFGIAAGLAFARRARRA